MSAKEELSEYRFKIKKAEQTLEEYESFKTRAEKVTAVMNGVNSRTNIISDKVGENAIKMAELSALYQKEWQEAELERLSLISKIKNLDEPFRTILFMRYIQEKSFEHISESIKYSYSRTIHLHGIALQLFDKNKNSKC